MNTRIASTALLITTVYGCSSNCSHTETTSAAPVPTVSPAPPPEVIEEELNGPSPEVADAINDALEDLGIWVLTQTTKEKKDVPINYVLVVLSTDSTNRGKDDWRSCEKIRVPEIPNSHTIIVGNMGGRCNEQPTEFAVTIFIVAPVTARDKIPNSLISPDGSERMVLEPSEEVDFTELQEEFRARNVKPEAPAK